MPEHRPEECDLLLVEALQKGDLEAALDLYEPNASFVQQSGETVKGHPAIREAMKGYLAIKPKFTIKVETFPGGDGTLALTQAKWSVSGTDAEGKPVTMSGRSAEVVHRQADGTWRFAIDNPRGGESN
jgi:uncharacterized protein (TIGR02246 family)